MLESFESISPTAILTSYPRTFTDIPYEKEIFKWLSKNCNENVKLNKLLAPEIEARYKLTDKIMSKLNIKQVLELAAGYSSRGLIYSEKDYNYVEMDLDIVSKNKEKMIKEIFDLNDRLHLVSGNALNYEDYIKCEDFFEAGKEIAVINEGLLRYLTWEEKTIVAQNVYKFIKQYGGVWITCDITPKKFIQKQHIQNPSLNSNLNTVTSRNNLNDRFEDENHIRDFFGKIGFKNIEIHKFIEVKDELKSFELLNMKKNECGELLESALVGVIRID